MRLQLLLVLASATMGAAFVPALKHRSVELRSIMMQQKRHTGSDKGGGGRVQARETPRHEPNCRHLTLHPRSQSQRHRTVDSTATKTAAAQPVPFVGARGEQRAVPGRLAPLAAFTSTLPDKDPSQVLLGRTMRCLIGWLVSVDRSVAAR